MKILHVAETAKGGVGTVIGLLVQPIQDFSSVVLAPRDHIGSIVCDHEKVNVVPFHRSGRNPLSLLRFGLAIVRLVVAERPDVVHCHSTFAGFIARPLCKIFGVPVIVYCPHAFSFLMTQSSWKRKFYCAVEKFLLPTCNTVICVSEFERDKAVLEGFVAEKLKVIVNGVAVPHDVPLRPSKEDTLRLLFVGRLDRQKGFDLLTRSLEKLGDVVREIVVAGEAVVASNHEVFMVDDRIRFVGWLDRDSLQSAFARTDLLVMPSRWEGLSMVLLEAMACGVPVLASDCTSMPEVIEDGKNGLLFKSESVDSLSQRIQDFAALDDTARTRISMSARETIMRSYREDLMISRTQDLYLMLLDK